MTEVSVDDIIPAPIDSVWALLRNFGDLSWGGIEGTKLTGEGVGAVRTFTARGGIEISERLESFDEGGHRLAYSILETAAVPWTDYLARIELTSKSANETHITWSGRLEPRGVTEEQASSIVRSIFENGIRSLTRALNAAVGGGSAAPTGTTRREIE